MKRRRKLRPPVEVSSLGGQKQAGGEEAMSQAWKQLEREVAKSLGGQRNPAAKGQGGPDVVDVPGWVLEAKYRATFAHDTLYREERAKRKKELRRGRKFALVTRARGKEPLVTLTLQDFAALVNGRTEPEERAAAGPLWLPLEEG
jgi:hypothetical protein